MQMGKIMVTILLTQNSDNILKRFVILQDLLYTTGNFVMLLSDDVGVHDTGGGIEGIDSGVDTQFGDGSGQHSGGVQVSKGGGGGRIGQVISGHINGLYGCDGSLFGGGNTLLHATHVSGQSGLVTDSRGDTTQKGRHL